MLQPKNHRSLRKRRDRDFQSDGNPRPTDSQETEWLTCPACGRTMEKANSSKHHIIGRSDLETRHDDYWSIRLCNKTPTLEGCHEEAERLGNPKFAMKHSGMLQLHAPIKFVLLLEN